jgi:signal peptidase II
MMQPGILTSRPTRRLAFIALGVLAFDQLTKLLVLHYLGYAQEKIIIDGFFNLVHWGNPGAAWSLFNRYASSNMYLAVFAVVALLVLFITRHHFDVHTRTGQVALGLIFGGIAGNLLDRFLRGHVIDFLYFHISRRGGGEIGFPAFNVADSAICIGVGLLFLLSWRRDHEAEPADSAKHRAQPAQTPTSPASE